MSSHPDLDRPPDAEFARRLEHLLHADMGWDPSRAPRRLEADSVTQQPDSDSEEETLMSIDEMTRTDSAHRGRRWLPVAIGAGIVAAAAAVAIVVLNSDGSSTSNSTSTDDTTTESSLAPPATAAPPVAPSSLPPCTGGAGACGPDLAPGTYASTVFDPAVTFTVGGNWSYESESAGVLGLTVQTSGGLADVYLVSQVRVPRGCDEVPDPSIGATSADISAAYAGAEELVTTPPQPVTVGGLTGVMMDLSMNPAWTGTCDSVLDDPSSDEPVAFHLIGEGNSQDFRLALIGADEGERLYLLDHQGATLAVIVHAPSRYVDGDATGPLADYIDEVTPFVDSLVFDLG